MALTYGFYNSVEGDRTYDAIQMGQIFDGIITDGVYATFLKAMVVKASENASEVIVQPGRCWFNHTWTYIDADYPVTTPAPEVILDRVDALVIDINTENAFRENSLVWVQGTPSSLNPERPTLIKSVTHNQYPLCYVYRKAGTTMIYAADITNAVGTSETPFVTGVLEGINIDDLLAQWDDEFHTWEAATKTSFEAWMVNQQSVYVTWFNSIKDQMEGDLTDFEAWFETIRGIIDEEAATHLQAEIDALSEMLPAGSHIDISTSESTLFNRNVTVSDGVHSKTVQFDSIGGATVESFPYIGIIDVSSTDGERTASEVLNIPYFGRYSATLAFWSATVNLVGDESLAAIPVTVRDSNGDVVAVVTLNASGQGVFTATKPDEYTFTLTYGGQTMEVSLAVTQETTYEVELHGGFRFDIWLEAGRVSKTFTSLDDILEDEPTLRQLMLVHDSVDYICDTFSESATSAVEDITKIFNCGLAAKWINLSDYALDHFYAVDGIKSIMDTADKYGYGELTKTYVNAVPLMTSATTPSGIVISSYAGTSGHEPYKAFDQDPSTYYEPQSNQSSNYIGYTFVESIVIKHIYIYYEQARAYSSSVPARTFYLQASNDGFVNDINSLYSFTISSVASTSSGLIEADIENEDSYLSYRLFCNDPLHVSQNYVYNIRVLKFCSTLEWVPKGNVPIMTSNTAPYGEVIKSGETSNGNAWRVFDRDVSTQWYAVSNATNNYVGYNFNNPIACKKVTVTFFGATGHTVNWKLQCSNDGTNWTDLWSRDIVGLSDYDTYDIILSNPSYYKYYRLFAAAVIHVSGNWAFEVRELQFYGRELKVSVPTMTSNTAPFGEAIKSGEDNSYQAYKVFDNSSSTKWLANDNTNAWIGYDFGRNTNVKFVYVEHEGNINRISKYKIQGSNDSTTWDDESNVITANIGSSSVNGKDYDVITINNGKRYHRLLCLERGSTTYDVGLIGLQFYGLDYSEKEFEAGTTKKWLYDHGVELEELTVNQTPSGAVAERRSDEIYLKSRSDGTTTTGIMHTCVCKMLDLTPYSLVKVNVGKETTKGTSTNRFFIIGAGPFINGQSNIANNSIATIEFPNYLDVSSVNQSTNVGVIVNGTNEMATVTELWLE